MSNNIALSPGILFRSLDEDKTHKSEVTDRLLKDEDRVRIHYRSFILGVMDDRIESIPLDSTYDSRRPLEFTLGQGQIVEGLERAVRRLAVGAKAEVIIPALFAYGDNGRLPEIPPRATLRYEVELLEVRPAGRH